MAGFAGLTSAVVQHRQLISAGGAPNLLGFLEGLRFVSQKPTVSRTRAESGLRGFHHPAPQDYLDFFSR
jgi:hypothetical protein